MKRMILFVLVLTVFACTKTEDENAVTSEPNSVIQKSNSDIFQSNDIQVYLDGQWHQGSPTVMEDYWRNSLGNNYPNGVNLRGFALIISQPDQDGKTSIFLTASSDDNTFSVGTEVEDTGGSYRIQTTKTCTCTGCPNGCGLTVSGNNCYCSGCNPSSDACSKTETQTTGY